MENKTLCGHCGQGFAPYGNQKFCGSVCRDAAKYQRDKASGAQAAKQARRLARETPETNRAKYERSSRFANSKRPVVKTLVCVEDGCTNKTFMRDRCITHWKHLKRAEGAAWAFNADHRSRARYYGVAYESVNRAEVFESAGWVCALCGEPIDPALPNPHPQSASVDCVVPMKLGGGYVRANVQAAHLSCNCSKQDRFEGGLPS